MTTEPSGGAWSRRPKGVVAETAEYLLVLALLGMCTALPAQWLYRLIGPVGRLAFGLLGGRRRLAVANVEAALGSAVDARAVALASFRSFGLAVMPELVKLLGVLTAADARERILSRSPELEAMFQGMTRLHESSGGCVFVTPHLGNWELMPFIAAAFGVPLAVVLRPLDNRFIDRLLTRGRARTGQILVARGNSMPRLRLLLARGRSVAMLPDQATRRGVAVRYLGREALTSPVPAMLAMGQGRPIVPCACYRTGELRFSGEVGEPIWPDSGAEPRGEILRLTAAMTGVFEEMVRAHPEQYLWMHNRWKSYE